MELTWYSNSLKYSLQFRDEEQVHEMFHSGDCEPGIRNNLDYFSGQLAQIPNNDIIKELAETGGWTEMELKEESTEDLHIKFLWICAGDLVEDQTC